LHQRQRIQLDLDRRGVPAGGEQIAPDPAQRYCRERMIVAEAYAPNRENLFVETQGGIEIAGRGAQPCTKRERSRNQRMTIAMRGSPDRQRFADQPVRTGEVPGLELGPGTALQGIGFAKPAALGNPDPAGPGFRAVLRWFCRAAEWARPAGRARLDHPQFADAPVAGDLRKRAARSVA
jgi:hypothetical protein